MNDYGTCDITGEKFVHGEDFIRIQVMHNWQSQGYPTDSAEVTLTFKSRLLLEPDKINKLIEGKMQERRREPWKLGEKPGRRYIIFNRSKQEVARLTTTAIGIYAYAKSINQKGDDLRTAGYTELDITHVKKEAGEIALFHCEKPLRIFQLRGRNLNPDDLLIIETLEEHVKKYSAEPLLTLLDKFPSVWNETPWRAIGYLSSFIHREKELDRLGRIITILNVNGTELTRFNWPLERSEEEALAYYAITHRLTLEQAQGFNYKAVRAKH